MNMKSRYANYLILILLFAITGCGSDQPNPTEVAGKYKIQYSNGQIEVWNLETDFTFEQNLYLNEIDYSNSKPAITYKDSWEFKDGNGIFLNKSYTFLDFGTLQVKKVPYFSSKQVLWWIKPDALELVPDGNLFADRQ